MNEQPCQLQTFSFQREWTVDGIPVLTASIFLPEPKAAQSKPTKRLQRYYQLQSRSYLRYCETWLFPQAREEYYAALNCSTPLPSFHTELTYQITYNDTRGFVTTNQD